MVGWLELDSWSWCGRLTGTAQWQCRGEPDQGYREGDVPTGRD
jgi:hypothetical protein